MKHIIEITENERQTVLAALTNQQNDIELKAKLSYGASPKKSCTKTFREIESVKQKFLLKQNFKDFKQQSYRQVDL